MTDSASNLDRRSAWSLRQNIARVIWGTLIRLVWVFLPPMRASLIRLFGGKVGRGCRFASTTEIYIPWNVTIGDHCEFGDQSIVYSLGKVTIGDRVVLDFRAHLCAGTHDLSNPAFPLIRPPITIGDECMIGADAYIGPDVTLGSKCRVWPRTSVYKDAPEGSILRGNPARIVENPEQEDDA